MSRVTARRVSEDDGGLRLDRWFKKHFPGLGHGRLQKLLRTGQVRVDGARAKAGLRLEPGQEIRVPPLPDEDGRRSPERRPRRPADPSAIEELRSRVIHMDASILVLDKPSGLAVQGGAKVESNVDDLLDALRFGNRERPRLVHRLDKDTSGVLLLARTPASARWLTGRFKNKEVRKLYWALVAGVPEADMGEIDMALAKRGGAGREKVVPDEVSGKRAITRFAVLERTGDVAAWLAMEPLTGRTHQLRVHAAVALGTPILADGKYGGTRAFLQGDAIPPRLHLHARALRVPHPDGGVLNTVAELPDHMIETARFLGMDMKDGYDFIEVPE